MTSLVISMGLFTAIPVPPTATIDRHLARRAIRWMPVVGLVLGILAAAVAAGVLASGAGRLLGAAMALTVLAALTGALHLDGLADTADGLGSGKSAAEALAIMKKSDIGPMGVATLVLALLLQLASLSSPAHSTGTLLACLVVAPMVARVPIIAATLPGVASARPGGFGSLFTGVSTARDRWLMLLVTMLCTSTAGALSGGPRAAVVFAAAAVGAWVIAAGWQRHLVRRLRGLTGDLFGSMIEACQLVFVLGCALGL